MIIRLVITLDTPLPLLSQLLHLEVGQLSVPDETLYVSL